MLKNVENVQPVPNRMQKVNGWSCTSWLWRPRQLGCVCLSNSCRPVVLNPVVRAAFGSQAPFARPSYFAASFFMALGNENVSYLKIPKKHRGPHKRPSRATSACLRPLV